MTRFTLRTFFVFAGLRVLSLVLHYCGPSPYGGRLVVNPDRFLPDAIIAELGMMGLITLFFVVLRLLFRRERARWCIDIGLVSALSMYVVFGQFDGETVRWLGQHISVTFLRTYFGVRDTHMLGRLLASDVLFSAIALIQAIVAVVAAVLVWRRREPLLVDADRKHLVVFALLTVFGLTAHLWLRQSEKRWRRVKPAAWSVAEDAWRGITGADNPRNPRRAAQDFWSLAHTGDIDGDAPPQSGGPYPLYRDTNLGELTPEEFAAQDRSERPNVIIIVFETMRGWMTGWHPGTTVESDTPRTDEFIRENAQYFPFTHSNGFPSVEGCMGMHLGLWPHFRNIVFSQYLHVRTLGFPEVLREAGYQSFALLGADPSFSNFTPWFQRWYDDYEYDPANVHDGPILDRFYERIEAALNEDSAPLLALAWTATTHPPYDVPPESGVRPADTTEERFRQAMQYADIYVSGILDRLKARDDWDNTIVILLGDHAQPTVWQRQHEDEVGELNPGHTWTGLAITGGWHGRPTPGRRDEIISHIDLAPTLLTMLNLRVGNAFIGQDLNGANFVERPAWAFRYDTIARSRPDDRTIFSMRGREATQYQLDRTSELSYGLLEGHGNEYGPARDFDIARYQDAFRYYGRLFDRNLLMPPLEEQ